MSTASEELESFYQFAELRLQCAARGETLDDIYAEWRAANVPADVREADVRAIQASLRDMDAGNSGRPIQEFFAEFRERNSL
jgi:hypothetical protein